MSIHPTAIVDPSAKIPASCTVGPYCVVGADVELGENCQLISHVVLGGPAKMGRRQPDLSRSRSLAPIRRT